ncbi:hypothetical protein D3C85_1857860 [compost metagenome]
MINTSAVATINQAVSPVLKATASEGTGFPVKIKLENSVTIKRAIIITLKLIFLIVFWFKILSKI